MKPVSIETELPAIAERAVLKAIFLAGEVPEMRAHARVLSLPAQPIHPRLLQQELFVVRFPNIKTTGDIVTNIVRPEDSVSRRHLRKSRMM